MKKKATGKKVEKAKKALKSSFKAMRKVIKKIASIPKKQLTRRRISPKIPKEKLVLKKYFSKIIKASEAEQQSTAQAFDSPDNRLPAYYAEDKLVLLVRDPWWLFGYWEVTPGREAQVMHELSMNGLEREKIVLRVYDVTGLSGGISEIYFDIQIEHLNSNWYIDTGRPDRQWMAEIGIVARGGRFFPLVRSNVVQTPSFGISDALDEEWLMPDEMYFKLLGVIGGFESAGSSMEVRKLIERRVRHSLASENSPKLSKAAVPPQKL